MLDSKRNKNEHRQGFNIGSASIIMVFSVLCLAMFAVLSVVTGNSDMKLARETAQSIRDYYAAEYTAEGRVQAIGSAIAGGSDDGELRELFQDVGLDCDSEFIRFTEQVDSRRVLRVTLERGSSGSLAIYGWELAAGGGWNPETGVPVWTGEG